MTKTQKEQVEIIRQQIAADDKACIRALLIVYARQTPDEQYTQDTRYLNGRGFNGRDAELLSSFAQQFQAKGRLTERQLEWAKKKMTKYAGQVLEAVTK